MVVVPTVCLKEIIYRIILGKGLTPSAELLGGSSDTAL